MPLRNYSKALEELILAKGRIYKIPKGQIIQSTEDRKVFNLIKSGYVKRYLIKNDGALGVQVVYGTGDIFPITLAFKLLFDFVVSDSPEVFYYEAVTDLEIFTINESLLKEAVAEHPELYRDLMLVAGTRLKSTLTGLENVTLKSSYKRVAHILFYFAKRFGKKTTDGTDIQLPLTHQDIADILSLTRETVSTSIIRLRRKKLIKTEKGIVVPDLDKLKQEAYG